jgi:hypothetical protein
MLYSDTELLKKNLKKERETRKDGSCYESFFFNESF